MRNELTSVKRIGGSARNANKNNFAVNHEPQASGSTWVLNILTSFLW